MTVELVWLHARLLGLLEDTGRELQSWEEVHCALRLLALDSLEGLEGVIEQLSPLLEGVVDVLSLGLVELVGLVALGWRTHHEVDHCLAGDHCADGERGELQDHLADALLEPDELEVAASLATLAKDTLGSRVDGCQLHVLVHLGVAALQVPEDTLEGVELALLGKHVLLVHLVREDDHAVLGGEGHDVLHDLWLQHGARRVARVDHDDHGGLDALGDSALDLLLNLARVRGPPRLLVEVVWDGGGVVERQRGGIDRVLGDGDEHSDLGPLAEQGEEVGDTTGGTVCEEDVGGGGRLALVTVSDVLGDGLTDAVDTLGARVCTNGASDLVQEHLGPIQRVSVERTRLHKGVPVL